MRRTLISKYRKEAALLGLFILLACTAGQAAPLPRLLSAAIPMNDVFQLPWTDPFFVTLLYVE